MENKSKTWYSKVVYSRAVRLPWTSGSSRYTCLDSEVDTEGFQELEGVESRDLQGALDDQIWPRTKATRISNLQSKDILLTPTFYSQDFLTTFAFQVNNQRNAEKRSCKNRFSLLYTCIRIASASSSLPLSATDWIQPHLDLRDFKKSLDHSKSTIEVERVERSAKGWPKLFSRIFKNI